MSHNDLDMESFHSRNFYFQASERENGILDPPSLVWNYLNWSRISGLIFFFVNQFGVSMHPIPRNVRISL